MDQNSGILFECFLFRLYKEGHVDRIMGTDVVPAGFDATTGVTSKDVVIDTNTGVFVRLYLPDTSPVEQNEEKIKLPVVVYVHGGGFVVETAASPVYHNYLNSVAAKAGVLIVSVNYRRAPEHPLPAAYDDSWSTLNWAVSCTDPWLSEHGDLNRVFLAGDSAGGNIVHNVAMKAGMAGLASPAQIEGVILLHAFFLGKEALEGEMLKDRELSEKVWSLASSEAKDGLDDPRINPMAKDAPSLEKLGCERMLVCESEKDFCRPWAKVYYDTVKASGWHGSVEWFENAGEEHVFFLFKHDSPEAVALMDRVVAFLAGN